MFFRLGKSIKKWLEVYAFIVAILSVGLAQVVAIPEMKLMTLVGLSLMLFPAMLKVDFSQFQRVLRMPGVLLLSLAQNFLLAPLLTYCLIQAAAPWYTPGQLAGFVLYGLIPCGGMVPAFTVMLRGNITLAITMMSLSLLLSVLIVPIWAGMFLQSDIAISSYVLLKHLAIIVLLPLFLAKITKSLLSWFATKEKNKAIRERLDLLPGCGILIVFFTVFSKNGAVLLENPAHYFKVALPVSLFILILLIVGIFLMRLFNYAREDAVAYVFSTTSRNVAIGIALAAITFTGETTLVVAIAGPMTQFPLMLLLVRVGKRLLP